MATFGVRGPNVRGTQRSRRKALGAAFATVLVGALAVGAQPGAAADLSLRGDWRFDEPLGDVALDAGPHGLDGRLGAADGADGSDPARIPGAQGGGLRFDGASFVRVPDAPELAPGTLTVEAVVRATASPGSFRYLVSRGGRGCFAGAYGLYTGEAGGIALYIFDGSRYVVTATARPADVWDGAWHHVAGTFDGDRLRLYVDGRPVGQPSAAVLRIDYASTSATTAFGRYVGSCKLPYTGDLDLVRVWSGALSDAAVADAAWRATNPSGPPAGPQPPLPAAAPPTQIDAEAPSGPPAVVPGAPERACALAVSRSKIRVRRKTPVRVRVTLRGAPVPSVRVVARQRGRSKPISAARTGATGHVRLLLRTRLTGRIRVSAAMRPTCSPRIIRVAKG